ncbi:MAG: glycosyltransferase [Proteobacteria bacterium]|nr:glycosyltransferase [Pseudomonadota bacterium]MCP4917548.1 glycosyltransferase [Pseudomonadota bacterium]
MILVALHAITCALLCLYGLHRLLLVGLLWRHRRDEPTESPLPSAKVCVQLPVYDERDVMEQGIHAAAALDWPDLEVQMLDDSRDDTTAIAQRVAATYPNVHVIHREDRRGFKAGALSEGLDRTDAEFIAIFDADFIPPPDFLRQVMGYFQDDVGMVQARWTHINRGANALTRLQAILLDGHFVIEHAARHRSGRWFNFNDTAGVWRRSAIDDAGGWQGDTLTEDLDLSYRAQEAGWKFVYLPDVEVPAELPEGGAAFRSQQHRWAKGGVQCARKLLPRLMPSRLSWSVRSEALAHLGANFAYPLVLLLALLTPPAAWLRAAPGLGWLHGLDVLVLVLATGSFVRTPKSGGGSSSYDLPRSWVPMLEAGMAGWQAIGLGLSIWGGYWESVPLQLLLLCGFAILPLSSPLPSARDPR